MYTFWVNWFLSAVKKMYADYKLAIGEAAIYPNQLYQFKTNLDRLISWKNRVFAHTYITQSVVIS